MGQIANADETAIYLDMPLNYTVHARDKFVELLLCQVGFSNSFIICVILLYTLTPFMFVIIAFGQVTTFYFCDSSVLM